MMWMLHVAECDTHTYLLQLLCEECTCSIACFSCRGGDHELWMVELPVMARDGGAVQERSGRRLTF
jgi:hypothetical protein